MISWVFGYAGFNGDVYFGGKLKLEKFGIGANLKFSCNIHVLISRVLKENLSSACEIKCWPWLAEFIAHIHFERQIFNTLPSPLKAGGLSEFWDSFLV